jgi:Fic-DOC domain mobile mystery protein B
MTDLFQEPPEATPLTAEERDGLLQTWITHRRDLNEAEHENIVKGAAWARTRRQRGGDLLTDRFAQSLHRRMFGDVWSWAGSYRQTEKNLGVHPGQIHNAMAVAFDNIRYWVEHSTFPLDEIAVRLHHSLVSVHPFPNGNGRHTRLMADLMIERLGRDAFTWGGNQGNNLGDEGELRARYIAALQAADNHDLNPLIQFARS